jgi:hypothetical protein
MTPHPDSGFWPGLGVSLALVLFAAVLVLLAWL